MTQLLKRILCIDDETDILAVAKLALETVGGFETRQCSSGAEALIEVDNYHPDLILLDVMMPQMDGYQTMGVIRENPAFRRLPIIALTAKAMKGDREKCLEAGASDYLAKPVNTEQLLLAIRMWLHR